MQSFSLRSQQSMLANCHILNIAEAVASPIHKLSLSVQNKFVVILQLCFATFLLF